MISDRGRKDAKGPILVLFSRMSKWNIQQNMQENMVSTAFLAFLGALNRGNRPRFPKMMCQTAKAGGIAMIFGFSRRLRLLDQDVAKRFGAAQMRVKQQLDRHGHRLSDEDQALRKFIIIASFLF